MLDPRFGGLATQIDAKQVQLFDRLDAIRDERLRLNHEQAAELASTKEAVATGFTDMQVSSWHVRKLVETHLETAAEVSALFGRSLADVRETVEAAAERLDALAADVAAGRPVPESVEQLDEATARLLEFGESHRGYAAQRSLWFNAPVSLEYGAGLVRVRAVNERIAEVPFVYQELAGLAPGARVLDVGACESLVSLSLASLGYAVTALDPRGYPFAHPNLSVVPERIDAWEGDGPFDAIVCLSTIEHVGIADYGEEAVPGRADLDAMARLAALSRAGTRLVLTAPLGSPGEDAGQRSYDEDGLTELLAGWEVTRRLTLGRSDATTWLPDPSAGAGIVLVAATRPG